MTQTLDLSSHHGQTERLRFQCANYEGMWKMDEVKDESVLFDMDMGCVKSPRASPHPWERQGLLSVRCKGMTRSFPGLSINVDRVYRNYQSQLPPPV